jgi:2-polyprenyl-3-methyl-5-hydroxy-6-metoxy-1,4-benzoquinol methylase
MTGFRESLYASYVSGHVAQRKRVADLKALRVQSRIFDQHFGRFLPGARDRAVDLGCGPGTLVAWLKDKGFRHAFGVDISAEQIANAHAIGVMEAEQGDLFAFLSRERDFDVIVARDVLEHLDKQSAFDLLRSARAALRPGGRIILQVPNAESPYFGRVRYGDFTHELAFTGGSMRQLLVAAGFSSVRVAPWRPAVFNFQTRIRALLWRLIEPVLKLPIAVESGSTADRIVTMNLIAVGEA